MIDLTLAYWFGVATGIVTAIVARWWRENS